MYQFTVEKDKFQFASNSAQQMQASLGANVPLKEIIFTERKIGMQLRNALLQYIGLVIYKS